jgi:hypothetical protein
MTNYSPDQIVKTCSKLQSGLRFGPEGVRACQLGPFAAPVYWTEEEASKLQVTKEMIVEKRRQLFEALNDDHSDIICKKCSMVEEKPFREVDFTKLGRIDHAPRTICNLRCNFCGFTHAEAVGDYKNGFIESNYSSLEFLKTFGSDDVEWDAAVDFNGGETSLIKNIKEYLDYFKEMKIRVLCFSNSVVFSEAIYQRLLDGSIQWLVTSIDCGTPSTYKLTKKGDVYQKVLENVTRYAYAGSKGGGNLAIKYIFTEDNCSDDDIVGFAYAMLAIRPQRVWLTFDFMPFAIIPPDAEDFCGFDFTRQIDAYAKLYKLLLKHGIEPIHYTEGHLARISRPGKLLLRMVLEKIANENDKIKTVDPSFKESVYLKDFREESEAPLDDPTSYYYFKAKPLMSVARNQDNVFEAWDLTGKTIMIGPATPRAIELLEHDGIKKANVIGFFDRSPALLGKKIQGVTVFDYADVRGLSPDIILAMPPQQHRLDIMSKLRASVGKNTLIAVKDDPAALIIR